MLSLVEALVVVIVALAGLALLVWTWIDRLRRRLGRVDLLLNEEISAQRTLVSDLEDLLSLGRNGAGPDPDAILLHLQQRLEAREVLLARVCEDCGQTLFVKRQASRLAPRYFSLTPQLRQALESESSEVLVSPITDRGNDGTAFVVRLGSRQSELGFLLVEWAGTDGEGPLASSSRNLLLVARSLLEGALIARSARRQRELLFSVAQEALGVLDLQGKFLEANEAWLAISGHTEMSIHGMVFSSLIEAEDRIPVEQRLSQLRAGRRVEASEARMRRADGTIRWIRWQAHPDLDERRIYIVAKDRTAERENEAALLRAEKVVERTVASKTEFIGTLSHEIRTPLQTIRGMTDLLLESELAKEQQNLVLILRRTTENLMGLISDIIDLSHLEADSLELDPRPFDLDDLIRRIKEVQSIQAKRKNLTLLCVVNPDVPRQVIGDQRRLLQVLDQLIGNAIQYTETGVITVWVNAVTSGQFVFSIADTGVGIPQERLEVLFDRMDVRDSFSASYRFGTTGFGLILCRRLVELMGGRIWAESQVGKGSTFFFSVPLQVAQEQARPIPEPTVRKPKRANRVLLADDSEDNQLLMQTILRWPDFEVEVAMNGQEAVDKFTRARFDLVLMDQEMPVMNGLTAMRQIRTWERQHGLQATPIVAISATTDAESIARSQRAGGTAHIGKPIDIAELAEMVTRFTGTPVSIPLSAPQTEVRSEMETNVIALDSALKRMLPVFVANKVRDLVRLKQALQSGDFDTVRLIGHSMKGTGRSYGFPAISELGSRLEAAAIHANRSRMESGIAELSRWLETMNQAMVDSPQEGGRV